MTAYDYGYVTDKDIERAIPEHVLIQLSNDDPAAIAPDEDNIKQAVYGAQELVDGFLRARYQLPLTKVPTILRELTLNLVRYRLYVRRPEGGIPENVKDLHDAALKVLDQVQSGKVTLGVDAVATSMPEGGAMRVKAPSRQFGESVLAKWR